MSLVVEEGEDLYGCTEKGVSDSLNFLVVQIVRRGVADIIFFMFFAPPLF